MVPDGWVHTSLGGKVVISSGIAPSSLSLSDKGKYPYVKVEDMNNCAKYQVDSRTYTDDKLKLISEGAVIFPKRGAAIMNNKVRIAATDLYLDSNMMSLFPKDGLDGEFLYYLLIREELHRIADTSTIPQINNKHINPYRVMLPPLPEQKKIAQILTTWDKAITTTEQLLANSLQQKKALMQQLFTGKKRLLDKNGVRFSGEWKFQSISQISKRIQRKSDGEDHPILTISSLSGFVRQDERYSRYMAGESVKNYILLKKGEFAYNKGNSKTYEFGCIFDLDSYKSGLVPHVYVCFKLHQGLSHRYFKYLFEADYLKPQLGALVNTGVRNNGLLNIKPSEFMNTKVPVPCFDEQEKIADVLHASSETINKLQLKLGELKQEKKALMQQLLTGKRRVLIS